MLKEIRCIIYGRVQGVMFRDYTKRKAGALGIKGKVKNLPSGDVEVTAQGEEGKLLVLIKKLEKGPFLARVDRIDTEWREPNETFNNFKIEY